MAADATDHDGGRLLPQDTGLVEAWLRGYIHRLSAVEVLESDLRSVVLNYFLVTGNQEAAEAWEEEAGLRVACSNSNATSNGPTSGSSASSSSSSKFVPRSREDHHDQDVSRGCTRHNKNFKANYNGRSRFFQPQGDDEKGVDAAAFGFGSICPAGLSSLLEMGSSTTTSYEKNTKGKNITTTSADRASTLPVAKMHLRKNVRNALLRNNHTEAIRLLDDISPRILGLRPRVHFTLLRRQFLQLLLDTNTTKSVTTTALQFAYENLTPFVERHPELLEKLEASMKFLTYDPTAAGSKSAQNNALREGIKEQLETDNEEIADRIDHLILQHFHLSPVSQLEFLCRNVLWSDRSLYSQFESDQVMIVRGLSTGLEEGAKEKLGSSKMNASTSTRCKTTTGNAVMLQPSPTEERCMETETGDAEDRAEAAGADVESRTTPAAGGATTTPKVVLSSKMIKLTKRNGRDGNRQLDDHSCAGRSGAATAEMKLILTDTVPKLDTHCLARPCVLLGTTSTTDRVLPNKS
ncbi:unnamed protein product [Amoebophrya sp. A120]|nr:unnamed protein product [Amoebophrya sp. A120]|eukprot:GSA120T00015051001.1